MGCVQSTNSQIQIPVLHDSNLTHSATGHNMIKATSDQNETVPVKLFTNRTGFFEWVQKQLSQRDDSCTMLTKDFWADFLIDFKDHHMNSDELNQFFDNLEKLIQFNFQGQCKVGGKALTIDDFGQKFHQLENQLHFKRKRAVKYLKFILSRNDDPNLKEQFLFRDLKFDMSEDETLKLAAKVRVFFQEDMKAFAFLSLYLQKALTQSLRAKTWQQVETEYTQILKVLEKNYPANTSVVSAEKAKDNTNGKSNDKQSNSAKENWELLKDEDKYELVTFQKGKVAYETLEKFVIEKSEEAKTKKEDFDKLVKYICYEKGSGFKSGVKIKNAQSKDSIFRTIEKLVEDEMKEVTSNEGDNERKNKIVSKQQVMSILAEETQNGVNKVKQILEAKPSILFKAKDLLRGKSTFEKVEYILEAREKIKKKVEESNGKYQIIEEKNKLFGKTKDLVLIIKIENVIAEFQLVLKLDSASNEFNHKIYELQRSKVYSMIPNLFVHNKKWSEEFFSDQLDLIDHVIDQLGQKSIIKDKDKESEQLNTDNCKKAVKEFKILLNEQNCLKKKIAERTSAEKQLSEKMCSMDQMARKQNEKSTKKRMKEIQKIDEIKYFKKTHNYRRANEILAGLKSEDDETNAKILFQKGQIKQSEGKYDEALEQYQKCLEIKTKILGPDSVDVATTLNNIGNVYRCKGDYSKALEQYQKCLEIKTKNLGPDSVDVATTLNNIGVVYQNKGDYSKALEQYQKCLEIRTKILGPDSVDVAKTIENIGVVYQNKGDYGQALEQYQKCLEIKTKNLGPDSVDVATTLNNIGFVYQDKGDYGKALEQYQKCLEIKTKILGSDSVDVAETIENIGVVYLKKGDYGKALEQYQKCLEIKTKILGSDSVGVAYTIENIGVVYQNKGDYGQALEQYQKCLEIKTKILGPDSVDVAGTLNNIGLVYSDKGDFGKALEQYQKCLEIQTKILGPDSVDVAATLMNTGTLYKKQGDYGKALEQYQKCLEIQTKILGPDSVDVAATLMNIGILYKKQGDYGKALEQYQKCLEIQTKILGPDSVNVEITFYNIGLLYQNQKNYLSALENFKKCLEIRTKIWGQNSDQVIDLKKQIERLKLRI